MTKTTRGGTPMSTYGWCWIDGEEDDEIGNRWIMITTLSEPDANGIRFADGEEIATIMCRDYDQVKREHPEWIARKERDASMICAALNAQGGQS